jgi:Ca-activated chloride channel family protein
MPVSVNVVPGDQAAGRTGDPEVTTELAFQRAQRTKREATDALRDGDPDLAGELYRAASSGLGELDLAGATPATQEEIASERGVLEDLALEASRDAMSARKRGRADYHMKARKRGRRR